MPNKSWKHIPQLNNTFKLFLITTLIFFSGCTHLNEGSVDFRVSPPEVSASHKNGIPDKTDKGVFETRYFYSDDSTEKPIQTNESLSIQMLQAFICDFHEGSFSEVITWIPAQFQKNSSSCQGGWHKTRGEIVVIANAFERNGSNSVTHDNSAKNKGRVIYYNEDVRESGQMLNFSNMPLYGPKKYEGNPFYLRLWVLDLDEDEDSKTKGMLKSLSSAGAVAYPPAAPALGILNSIGGTLLSGPSNDTELQYQTEFDAPGGHIDLTKQPLIPGYYAMVRMEERHETAPWEHLIIDKRTGQLNYCQDTNDVKNLTFDKCVVYKKETWLTFKIDKNKPSFKLDAGQKYLEFQAANQKITQKSVDDFVANMQTLTLNIKQLKVFDNLQKQIVKINTNTKGTATRDEAIRESLNVLCDAVKADDIIDKTKSILPTDQIDYFKNKLIKEFGISSAKLSNTKLITECDKKNPAGKRDISGLQKHLSFL